MTKKELEQKTDSFVSTYLGQSKGYPDDSQYWGQCLSIVKLYIKEVFGISPPPVVQILLMVTGQTSPLP
jgi:hypothetical protein